MLNELQSGHPIKVLMIILQYSDECGSPFEMLLCFVLHKSIVRRPQACEPNKGSMRLSSSI